MKLLPALFLNESTQALKLHLPYTTSDWFLLQIAIFPGLNNTDTTVVLLTTNQLMCHFFYLQQIHGNQKKVCNDCY